VPVVCFGDLDSFWTLSDTFNRERWKLLLEDSQNHDFWTHSIHSNFEDFTVKSFTSIHKSFDSKLGGEDGI